MEYTSDTGRTVIVTNEPFPGTSSNISNTKCIEFTSGAPSEYTEACVTSIFSGNDQLEGCKVSFDGTECNACSLCTDIANTSIVGMQLNCNNRLPSKNIQSDCLAYSDAAIQEILDMGYFTEPFDFEAAAPEAAPAGGNEGGSSGTVSLSTVCVVVSALMMAMMLL
ncbi:hypothetical protein FisN_6Lh070 [Fistulifera solaris]|uniref:Uncharacterized protein n=1 Tax=Fistulifera solaris TaxID=1519565 RepID=A0A1Z5K565_FISSO|nr:hypothetical protein FisN_6Lh070 [Fistulifera solaris]|eukprot:GAX21364.1 hypothetical protein FisN_6Lh070 [Fistulifera solaris]